ncbi:MAG: hypothetical protein WBF42_04335 [Terracidiphilus sp.]
MLRITFAVAMVMVALSSNPFMRKHADGQGSAKPVIPASRHFVPKHETAPAYSHNGGAKPQARRGGHIDFEAVGV